MHWDVEPKAAKRLDEIAKAVKGANKLILATDPDREGEAISWHVFQVLNRKKALDKRPRRARGLQRRDQGGRARRHAPPARDRRAAGQCLSRPPGARLSRRLHAVAGLVAEAAGRPLGRPRAVRGAAARLRPRSRNRGLQDPGILVARSRARHRRRTKPSSPASLPQSTARSSRNSISPIEATAMRLKAALEGGRFVVQSVESKAAAPPPRAALHHLDPPAGSLAQARLLPAPYHAARPAAL